MPTANYYGNTQEDGVARYLDAATWAEARDAASGTGVDTTDTYLYFSVGLTAAGNVNIQRNFIPIDTTALPAGANITSAALKIYQSGSGLNDSDGYHWITVVLSTSNNTAGLEVGDYSKIGTAEGVDSANRITIAAANDGTWLSLALNATGISWIQKGGITKFGIREGHDVANHAYAGSANTLNRIVADSQEGTNPPYLQVTYTADSQIKLRWTK